MPYDSVDDLPPQVKDNLPTHAQHIFLKAFDHAWQEYAKPTERRDPDESQEEAAFRVTWSAVKKEYHKEGDKWVRNSDEHDEEDRQDLKEDRHGSRKYH